MLRQLLIIGASTWLAIALVAYLASTIIPAAWIHYQLVP